MQLPLRERALLAADLWESVASDPLDYRVDEVEQREREMDGGALQEISYEELLRRVKAVPGGTI
jgi:hypothetical protein